MSVLTTCLVGMMVILGFSFNAGRLMGSFNGAIVENYGGPQGLHAGQVDTAIILPSLLWTPRYQSRIVNHLFILF